MDELVNKFGKEITNKPQWKASANFTIHKNLPIKYLIDGSNTSSSFGSKEKRTKGQAITIELPSAAYISEVVVDSKGLADHYSRFYTIEFSVDGVNWDVVINKPNAVEFNRDQTLGQKAKFVRITNQVGGNRRQWRLKEVSLFGSYL